MSAPLVLDAAAVAAACPPADAVAAITAALDRGLDPAADLLPRVQGSYLLLDAAARGRARLRTPGTRSRRHSRRRPGGAPGARLRDAARPGPRSLVELVETRVSTGGVRPDRRGAGGQLGAPESDDALRTADVVVCATSAREPLFDAALIADRAVVIAVGSHEPDARELPTGLLGRATVVVEDRAAALREAGDVVLAIAEGALRAEDLVVAEAVLAGAR